MITSTLQISHRVSQGTRTASLLRLGATLAATALVGVLGSLVGGCARGVATTTVHPNGSWVRSVTYHGTKPSADGSGGMGTSIGDVFVLPTGAGWKVTHADTKDEAVVVAERTLAPGEVLHGDISTKSGQKSLMPGPASATAPKPTVVAVNEVAVRQTAPGVFEYKETFHWKGPAPQNVSLNAETMAAFKKALPPALATDADARDLATQTIRDLWHVMFGPGDPLISQISSLMTQPELVERRVQQRVGATLEQHIEAKFGTQVSAEQRRMIARNIIHNALFSISNQTKSAAPGSEKSNSDDAMPSAALFISVTLPGHVTATNGEQDAVNGDVYWALYPEAAALGDVTLTATCDTNAR